MVQLLRPRQHVLERRGGTGEFEDWSTAAHKRRLLDASTSRQVAFVRRARWGVSGMGMQRKGWKEGKERRKGKVQLR